MAAVNMLDWFTSTVSTIIVLMFIFAIIWIQREKKKDEIKKMKVIDANVKETER